MKRIHITIEGAQGTGKSYLATQIANLVHQEKYAAVVIDGDGRISTRTHTADEQCGVAVITVKQS